MTAHTIRVVPLADFHSGLRVSLMVPGFRVGEMPMHPGITQKWLMGRFRALFHRVFDGTADEVVLFLMGDEVHGLNGHFEIWAPTWLSQMDNYIQLVLPWVNRASTTYAIKGTKWHVGEDGYVEDMIARELGVFGRRAFAKLDVEIGGVRFRLSHKGPSVGTREWTRDNSLRLTLKDRAMRAARYGLTPADIYLWAHFHEYVKGHYEHEDYRGRRDIYGYVLPSWTTPNEYAMTRVDKIELADIGSIYFDITDGVVTKHDFWERYDPIRRVVHGS